MGKVKAVFNIPAVGISALIGVGGQKLADKIAMGPMDFNAVKARGNRASGSLNKTFYNLLDLKEGYFPGHGVGFAGKGVVLAGSNRAGSDDPSCGIYLRPCHSSAMEYLHDGNRACTADRLHYRFPCLNLLLFEYPCLPRISLCAFIISDNCLGVDNGGPVSGPSDQEVKHILAGDTVFNGRHPRHRRNAYPVFQLKIFQLKGRKKDVFIHSQPPAGL